MEKTRFTLNPEQLKAVEHTDGPLLVVAGAGTGKTAVVTRRIARLIERGTAPDRILALTFTEKAASEMEERVDRLVPYGYSNVWISTFHSFADRVLRDNALTIGLVPDFKLLTEAECVIFLKEHLFELPLKYFRPAGDPTRYLSALIRFIARLKDEDVSPDEFLSFCQNLKKTEGVTGDYIEEQTELARTYAAYQELKFKHGYMDFGDQCYMALELLRTRPAILKRYQEKFLYMLADEFQDTNYAQFELLKLLAGERKNITVVADDDQSIYKFRGAAISNVLGFMDVWPEAGCITLTRNYRSVQPILDSAYRLIQHNNPDRLEVKNGIDKRLKAVRPAGKGPGVTHLHFETLSKEAEFVARTIAERIEGGARLRDFAVLVRANNDAVPFLRALSERAIAHRFSGSSGLYSMEDVRLLISFLKAVTDHTDNLSLFHLASSPVYSIKAKDLVPLNNISRRTHTPLFNVLRGVAEGKEVPVELSEEGLEGIKRLAGDMERLSEMALKETTGRVLYAFLTETGYISKLSSAESEESVDRIRNIARFFEITTHIENTLSITQVHTLVEHLTLLMDAGDDPATVETDPDADYVHVITVHKAKGLEFPVVFMVGLVGERFPRRERKDTIVVTEELVKEVLPSGDFHMQEERRLFYVGMTRAADELYLTSAADYGGVRAKKVSPFVLEAVDMQRAAAPIKSTPEETIERFAPAPRAHLRDEPLPEDAVLHLSYYQIDDYLTCPHKYRFVHVLKVPLLPHHAIMYGKAMHEAIKVYFRRKMDDVPTTEGELIDILKASWRSEGFVSREHEQARWNAGVEALKRFLERERGDEGDEGDEGGEGGERGGEGGGGITPSAVEREFSVELGKNIIVGRWDLIEEREDGPYIIDFKTSDVREKKKADRRTKESVQLRLYALAYRECFNRLPAGVELHFLESGMVGSATFGDKEMEKTVKIIEEVASGIRKRAFEPKPGYNDCNWCAFNNICPERVTGALQS